MDMDALVRTLETNLFAVWATHPLLAVFIFGFSSVRLKLEQDQLVSGDG